MNRVPRQVTSSPVELCKAKKKTSGRGRAKECNKADERGSARVGAGGALRLPCVQMEKTFYLLNPSGDLANTQVGCH